MTLLGRLHELSLRRPVAIVLLWLVMVLGVSTGAPSLKIRTDGAALVPGTHPAVIEDKRIREVFDLRDPVVIVIQAAPSDTIFNPTTLRLVEDWTQRLLELPGISPSDLFSLATERSDRVFPGTLQFRRLLDPFPESVESMAALRDYLRAIRIFHGTLLAQDESATAIMVSLPLETDRPSFVRAIRKALEGGGPIPEGVSFLGAPIAESLLGSHLLQDLGLPGWLIGRQGGLELADAESEVKRTEAQGGEFVLRRIGMVPLAMAIIGVIILVSFASPLACVLPMIKVGACLAFLFGFMGWVGAPIYLPTAVMPVILTVAAITEEVHLLSRYADALRNGIGASQGDVLRRMLPSVHVPMVKTAITTAIGFLAFMLAPIVPVRSFGLWTCLGVLFSMIYTLIVTPAVLSLLPARVLFPFLDLRQSSTRGIGRSSLYAWGMACARHAGFVAVIVLIFLACVPWGISKVFVQDSWIDGFSPSSRFARAAHEFNDDFLGMHQLHIALEPTRPPLVFEIAAGQLSGLEFLLPSNVVTAHEISETEVVGWRLSVRCPEHESSAPKDGEVTPRSPLWSGLIAGAETTASGFKLRLDQSAPSVLGLACPSSNNRLQAKLAHQPWIQPEYLVALERFEDFLSRQGDMSVGGVLGPARYLKTTAFIIWGKKESARVIPEKVEQLEWIWEQYGKTRGEARRLQVVDAEFQGAVITVFLKNANFMDTARLLDQIREYEATHWKARGISLTLAGDVAVSQAMIAAVVSTPIRSIAASLIGIWLVASLVGRSMRIGLLCAIPSTLAVLASFAFMGWWAVPLGVATSMFAAMTLGIGDDFAIHLIEHVRQNRACGETSRESVARAVSAVGGTLMVDACALALGFGVLLMSQVPANARLGLLLVLGIAACLAATLTVLPALLVIFPVGKTTITATDHEDGRGGMPGSRSTPNPSATRLM